MIPSNREQRRQLERDNLKRPLVLTELKREFWPDHLPPGICRVWISRHFLCQEYEPAKEGEPVRLSFSRTSIDPITGRWMEGITWDDIQRLKREAGYGDRDAVEIYPADKDVVNVANMRHIFLMDEPIKFAWRR